MSTHQLSAPTCQHVQSHFMTPLLEVDAVSMVFLATMTKLVCVAAVSKFFLGYAHWLMGLLCPLVYVATVYTGLSGYFVQWFM